MRIISFFVLVTMFFHLSHAGTVQIIVGTSLDGAQDRGRFIRPGTRTERPFDRLATDYIRQVFPLSADEYLRNFADSLDTLKKLHPESRNLLIQVIQSVENGKLVDNRKRLAIHGLLGIIHYLKRHHP